jgi:hypothetical protein
MSMKLDLETIFAQISTGGAEHVDKVAEAQPASEAPTDIEKLAEEFRAGGEIFADAIVDRLAKLAEAVPAGGGGVEPRSLTEQIADRIAKTKGKGMKPGDDTSIRAEANPTPGAQGVANPATALG